MHTIQDSINKIIEKVLSEEKKIIVGVSGGPDSMYLLYKLKSFWKEKGYEKNNLQVITCNHRTRKENKEETLQVKEFSFPHPCSIVEYQGVSKTETVLRKRRHEEFIKQCHQHAAKYIFVGHHLNDRIETTVLNIIRGCGTMGIQSLQYFQEHYLDNSIHIIRPLINVTKVRIEQQCQINQIPYSIDPSNKDILTSERNKVREVLENMDAKKNIEKSFIHLYRHLDKIETTAEQKKEETGILLSIKAGERTENAIYEIYQQYKISINPRNTTLSTLVKQLQKAGSKVHYQGLTIRAYSYGSVIEKTKN